MNTVLGNLWGVAPLLTVSAGALLVLLLEVFIRGRWPRAAGTAAVLICAIAFVPAANVEGEVWNGFIYADSYTQFLTLIILIGTLFTVLMAAGGLADERVEMSGEFYALLLFSTAGAIALISAAELITLFIALEVMSVALYALCGAALSVPRSAEAALKYFLLGSFSSAFLLFGMALVFGLTGTTSISTASQVIEAQSPMFCAVAVIFISVGVLFKVAAVPFHFWSPDVYQGAPGPVTAYMATVVKAASIGLALRMFWGLFGSMIDLWGGGVAVAAVLTMTLGNLAALRQQSVKRMLAWSSVAHAGYILLAFPVPVVGSAAVLFYLIAYLGMTCGAFAVLHLLCRGRGEVEEAERIECFRGLGSTHPAIAGVFALFLLSLAGIPPGMAGLLGKFYVFGAVIEGGFAALAIIGLLNSALAVYYYLRVLGMMYFQEAPAEGRVVVQSPDIMLAALLAICVVMVLAIGIFPGLFYRYAMAAVAMAPL